MLHAEEVGELHVAKMVAANGDRDVVRDLERLRQVLVAAGHLGRNLVAAVEFHDEPADLLLRFDDASAVENVLEAAFARELPDTRRRRWSRAEPRVRIAAPEVAALQITNLRIEVPID